MILYDDFHPSRYRRRRRKRTVRSRLSLLLAGLDREIEEIFFSLPDQTLTRLIRRYASEYGDRAADYACATYEKWKSGEVKLSGETAERLVNLLPHFLPSDVKYGFVKKLRDHYRASPVYRSLSTSFENWKKDLLPIVNEVVGNGKATLPDELIQKAQWLADGDCAAALRLLARAEREEAKIRLSFLQSEFKRLQEMISRVRGAESIRHAICLPQGTIHLTIQQPKRSLWQKLFGK